MSRPAAASASAQCGFTLIELMVTMALVAVMLILAAPNFIAFQRNSELTTTANNFLATLSAARAEAMKRQLRTFVIPAVGTDWSTGWVAFVDVDSNVSDTISTMVVGTGDIELARGAALPSSVAIDAPSGSTSFVHGSVKYAMFNGSGFMTLIGGGFPSGGAHSLDFTSGTGETRRVLASSAGRIRVCKPTDAGCSVSAGF
ncbi:MAG: GspH/FimT family pseudopilin [Burkholderiales bacterium]